MSSLSFDNKKVLILGFSITGIAAAKYLAKNGARCYLSEYSTRENFAPEAVEELEKLGVQLEFGGHSSEFMIGSELAVVSPGIAPDAPVIKKLKEFPIKCISDIELAYMVEGEKMLAITGTNGKTTSTMLASFVLSTKYRAPYCGNIGISPCDFLGTGVDFLVTEVSSAQLEYSPDFAPKIAIYTNFTPDHLNWHGSEEAYFEAKAKMFERMEKNSYAILNYDDKKLVGLSRKLKCKVLFFSLKSRKNAYIKDNAIFYKTLFKGEKIIDINEVPLVGPHNIQNVMGVIIMSKLLGLKNEDIKNAIKAFKAPPHRCEFICECGGTKFYNDSKATNPEAAMVAINSFQGKKVCLIAGGRDKNTSLAGFCEDVKKNIDSVVLLGEAKERFKEALTSSGFVKIIEGTTLEDAIEKAIEQNSDIVLFSPACASFDMFRNYEERGEAFKKYVLSKR